VLVGRHRERGIRVPDRVEPVLALHEISHSWAPGFRVELGRQIGRTDGARRAVGGAAAGAQPEGLIGALGRAVPAQRVTRLGVSGHGWTRARGARCAGCVRRSTAVHIAPPTRRSMTGADRGIWDAQTGTVWAVAIFGCGVGTPGGYGLATLAVPDREVTLMRRWWAPRRRGLTGYWRVDGNLSQRGLGVSR
jgi:hypothetical protein